METENKHTRYGWKQINVSREAKKQLDELVAFYSTGNSKGIMSTIVTRLINEEYNNVFKK